MANQVIKSVIVKGDLSSIYNLWANFENFPHFMHNLHSVKQTGPQMSEWTLVGPLGAKVRWNAEMTRAETNKRIAWSSKDNKGTITTSGQVTFNALNDKETEVTVILQYAPPGGKLGDVAARVLANPEAMLEKDLRNFKAFVEGMYDRTLKK